ncbi:MAG: hypothetical protein AAF483_19215 [Planctomycetota bacterium]
MWTGRIERGTGVWFDFDIEAEFIDKSKFIAVQSHLSSSAWTGCCYGFLAAPLAQPLQWSNVVKNTFRFDKEPASEELQAFMLYRNSHQLTGDHELKIRREPKKKTFKLDWCGQIGDLERPVEYFDRFQIKLTGIDFDGIHFPPGVTERDAVEQIAHYVYRPEDYRYSKRKEGVVMLPPASKK